MSKLLKNKIFTLIVALLLTALAVLMILDGLGVGDWYLARRMIHPLAGVLLIGYVSLVLIPMLLAGRGVKRWLTLAEAVLLALAGIAHVLFELIFVPLFSSLTVCALIALTVAARGVVLTVCAYLKKSENPIPLWGFILYLCMVIVGVWQTAAPLVSDRFIILLIGAIAFVTAVYFAIGTVLNFKRTKKKTRSGARSVVTQRDA